MPLATGKLSIWTANTNAATSPTTGTCALVERPRRDAQAQRDAGDGDDAGEQRDRGRR